MSDDKSNNAAEMKKRMAKLAAGAELMAKSIQSTMITLSHTSSNESMRLKLVQLQREFELQRLSALDIASGERDRRRQPMVKALFKARAEGGNHWVKAMECLAQCALEEARPAWYAGVMLSHLGLSPMSLPVGAAKALVEPINIERILKSPSYRWDWPGMPGDESRELWGAVTSQAGVVW